ncbi:MAG: ABC transporter permease [Owenweeksia sp.]|nr:ABC transporter permease [Owenweeksia sp.]
MVSQILEIVKLNITLEWRQRQSILAVLLYVLTTTYLSYLVFNGIISSETWNALYWIILIFAAVQAAFRSFQNEADRRFLLYYSLVPPRVLVIGKTIYNFFYLLVIGLVTFALFLFLLGNIVADPLAFVVLVVLASAGFACILTFVSGIAAKAGDNPALPAILSIPLLYPQVLALSRTSIRALTGFSWSVNGPVLLVLLLLALVSLLLSYLLFAYLWRD